ncbi:MAG: bacteriohopanetetrol glucosamine biosynthesis glycosyltransferase HpnI [Acidobacteria bacterium]|nr:bacteriohopanetetrol glucosamine biosynthesis glycosyltransferase HpnI [Acidobacteriota bacterium]
MTWALGGLIAAAAAYQVIAIVACVRQWLRREPPPHSLPPVSILKPVHGPDPHFYAAIRSHARQDYPEFEVLFGVHDPADPAIPEIERLQREFPAVPIELVRSATRAPNPKVGVLIDLDARARYPVRLVNDGDIHVAPDYLRRVVGPLEDRRAGLVTCLYCAGADSFPARMEALGIATDFAPGALVAPLFGVNEFGLGATLAFRAETLQRIGGFPSIRDYLADDYMLGKRISRAGLKVRLSTLVVRTHLGSESWRQVWRHQVRWARTIRMSRGAYAGLPIANATLWAAAAALSGWWAAAGGLLALRYLMGLVAGLAVLRCPVTPRLWVLMPLRDLFGFAVWAAGLFGRTVYWRGTALRLHDGGRIV